MSPTTIIRSEWRKLLLSALSILSFIISLIIPTITVEAVRGMPDSPEFGYGVRIDPWASDFKPLLKSAASYGFDWVSIDFDWEKHWPDEQSSMDLSYLSEVIHYAQDLGLSILVSITNPPAWATNEQGPDPDLSAGLVVHLDRLYGSALLAVELFPAANTEKGWRAPPDPGRYVELLKTTGEYLAVSQSDLVIIAAGLEPLGPEKTPNDIDDLDYLHLLYKAGALPWMPVVSIRMNQTVGDAMSFPSESDVRVIRHYEEVRSVMRSHEHQQGLIWITGFTWPLTLENQSKTSAFQKSGSLFLDSDIYHWLTTAYQLMRSQLYIGAVFYDCLNRPGSQPASDISAHCLIQENHGQINYHPAIDIIAQIIKADKNGKAPFLLNFLTKKIASEDFKDQLKAKIP